MMPARGMKASKASKSKKRVEWKKNGAKQKRVAATTTNKANVKWKDKGAQNKRVNHTHAQTDASKASKTSRASKASKTLNGRKMVQQKKTC